MLASAKLPNGRRTLTVAELREALEGQPDEMSVVFVYNYGDYSRTQAAGTINEVEEQVLKVNRGYSESGWALPDNQEDALEELAHEDEESIKDSSREYVRAVVIRG